MAISAVAAVASAGAVSAGIVTVSTLATISTVVGVVGVITGSKTLAKLGLGMGIASLGMGLISKLGEGAAGLAAEAAAEGGVQAASSAVENTAATAATEATNVAGGLDAGGLTEAGNLGGIDGAVQTADAIDTAAAASSTPSSSIVNEARSTLSPAAESAGTSTVTQQGASTLDVAGPSTPAEAGVRAPSGPADVTAPISPADQLPNETAKLARQNAAGPGQLFSDPKSFFASTFEWMEKNPTLTAAGMNMAGGALKGLGDSRQADLAYEVRQRQFSNASAQPTVNFTVNRNANVFPSQPQQYAGIVARARS